MPIESVASPMYAFVDKQFNIAYEEAALRGDLLGLLFKELARVGWDVPSVSVLIDVIDLRDKGLISYISEISGDHFGKPFRLTFSGYDRDRPNKGLPKNLSKFECGGEILFDGSVELSEIQRDIFEDIVVSMIARAKSIATSPGAADVTVAGDANIRRVLEVIPIPAPSDFPILYSWLDPDQMNRTGQDYMLAGTGTRLVALGDGGSGHNMDLRVFDGFNYASADISKKADQGTHYVDARALPVMVKLRYLNEIYVVDMSARWDVRARLEAEVKASGRDRFSREEFIELQTAAAKTMIPATEYSGDFKEPVYLIGRRIYDDEARFMRGNLEIEYSREHISMTMVDRQTGLVVPFMSTDDPKLGTLRHYVEVASSLEYSIGCKCEIPKLLIEEIAARQEMISERRRLQEAQQNSMRP